jgi:hypothetical protein
VGLERHRYRRVDSHVYIIDIGIVKSLSQCKQMYSLPEIILMLELKTLQVRRRRFNNVSTLYLF